MKMKSLSLLVALDRLSFPRLKLRRSGSSIATVCGNHTSTLRFLRYLLSDRSPELRCSASNSVRDSRLGLR